MDQDSKEEEEGPLGKADFEKMLPQMGDQMRELLSSGPERLLPAVTFFRRILAYEKDPPIDAVVALNAVPRLVELLKHSSAAIQCEAAWALSNICHGTSEHVRAVVHAGAVTPLLSLLGSEDAKCREQAVLTLGNIAGESPERRDLLLRAGVVPSLVGLTVPGQPLLVIKLAIWALGNLVRGKPTPPWGAVKPMLPAAARLLNHSDPYVINEAVWIFAFLANDKTETNLQREAIVNTGCLRRLVELMTHKDSDIASGALRTCANIAGGADEQTQALLDAGGLPVFSALLQSPREAVVKDALLAISNVTGGTAQQTQMVIDAGVFSAIIQGSQAYSHELLGEAMWALCNVLAEGTREQRAYAVEQGILPACARALSSPLTAETHKVILEGLDSLVMGTGAGGESDPDTLALLNRMDEAGIVGAVERLQSSPDEEVYKLAFDFLSEYFNVEEVESGSEGTLSEGVSSLEVSSSSAAATCNDPPPG